MPGLGSVSTGLLHHEISRLNGLLEEKISECERLDREVDKVRRRDQERIQTLEQQVGATSWSQCYIIECMQLMWHLMMFLDFELKKIKGSLFSSIRYSSTQRILSPSVPTESEHKARSKT